jgi:hypothetical protein
MSEFSAAPPPRARRGLLIWAVTATLAAVVLGNIALIFWLRLRQANASSDDRVTVARESSASHRSSTSAIAPDATPFENLQESDVAGRYRFFQDGVELGSIKLLPSHSIINKDGTTYPRYHWEIRPDGIMTTWQRGDILLNVMEKPGVYVARKNDGSERLRLEKIPE